jgi:predicted PurR-regulated permease PerM
LRSILVDPDSGLARVERIVVQVRTYLLVKTLTSLAVAVIAFVWLTVWRVDLALLLAVILFLLHFIPNVGAPIAAVPAIAIALVQRGPGVALAVGIGYLVAGTVVGNVIEPRVLGRAMGLSPLVVLLSMLFWGFVWGPAGAVLSVPLTMVAKIVLANDQEWAWIARLLEPTERLAVTMTKPRKTTHPGAHLPHP